MSTTPFPPDPEMPEADTRIKSPILPDPPPAQEDLTGPVPLGEPEDEGYLIQEEDPEHAPPAAPKY